MFYNSLVKFRDEQLENYQGQPLEYSASDYHHISRPGEKVRRGRSQNGRNKRKSHLAAVKDFQQRISSTQEPKSCASVESYDPYRSPKHLSNTAEAKYAQITIHRELPESPQKDVCLPVVKPPPSIAEEEEPDEPDAVASSPFTVLQKRKHKVSSMRSINSSRVPNSSSRFQGLSTRSTSYRRNVSFHHARNRSQGSTQPKRRKMGQNQASDLKRSPSAASLQLIADGIIVPDIPSSPPLPAQPTVVRPSNIKVKSLSQAKKLRDSDFTWKEDARKVSNELSKICEEAFNGSSLTTMRSTSSGTGYETPATPVSIASPEQKPKASDQAASMAPKDSGRSYSIQELTETRRKLVEHSMGRSDNVPAYLSGVISQLDRLIEEDKANNEKKQVVNESIRELADPFTMTYNDTSLPVINEEFASPVRGPVDLSSKSACVSNRQSDNKATIRMVPHSSLRSLEEVKPLMIRKKNQPINSNAYDVATMGSSRDFSAMSRQSRHTCGLDPIEEVPGSPKRADKTLENKKWSWFKHRSQAPDAPPALPPKDRQAMVSNNSTGSQTAPQDPASPIKSDDEKVPTRKTSMERFGGVLLKKLMPKKSNKNVPQPANGMLVLLNACSMRLTFKKDNDHSQQKDPRNSTLLCKGFNDSDSSFKADDPKSPFYDKRRSIANHNWFARVFQIKPASRVIALNTSKVKGRKEVYKMLREWKDYGMENVYMDKSNSIVHGQVGEVNCELMILYTYMNKPLTLRIQVLRLREVEFTAEFFTVLEHGRQANLSLVRFKQERGAASSFNKVVDTVYLMLKQRGLIVDDPERAKKMSRVLNTIPNNA